MTDMMELAKRVEALDGPCRDVDRAIAVALGIKPTFRNIGAFPNYPKITASLDAAMKLVPDGYQFCVTNGNGAWVRRSAHFPTIHGDNKHPALALTAAALRAGEPQ